MTESKGRSVLDEIEDYHYAVKLLVRKRKTDLEAKELLLKRGLDDFRIDNLIKEVRRKYKGYKMYETRKAFRFLNFVIDIGFLLSINLFWINQVPLILKLNTISQWGLIILILLIYYLPLEAFWGITLGKLITDTRVIDEKGKTPSFSRILLRTICRLIPNPWWIDRFWHDRISKTFVINRRDLIEIKM